MTVHETIRTWSSQSGSNPMAERAPMTSSGRQDPAERHEPEHPQPAGPGQPLEALPRRRPVRRCVLGLVGLVDVDGHYRRSSARRLQQVLDEPVELRLGEQLAEVGGHHVRW